jgi:two-component system CheB/CheR fusion protein
MGRQPKETERPAGMVVAMGSSAAGLEALEQLFVHLPARTGFAFVVVQELDAGSASSLADRVARHTDMPVAEAADGVELEPDHVYCTASGTLLALENRVFRTRSAPEPDARAPLDAFFRSLAEDAGERAVGILFSAGSQDGTLGLRAIQERGGLTLAQSPGDASRSGVDAGLVDHVLPPDRMAEKLLEHADHLAAAEGARTTSLDAEIEDRLAEICALVQQRTGHDFADYKQGTLLRRIRRRFHALHVATAAGYFPILESDPTEAETLAKDLLIGVTQFFRDTEAFEALALQVMPLIVQSKTPDEAVRIWVAGCASGEEAYSIAILVHEHLERNDTRRFVQIFATDLDVEMLAEARQGRYPLSIAERVGPERLARYFTREGRTYRVGKELREMCVFSQHSLIRDPPFSQLDLISCRNVLIYLSAELQTKIVPLLHYALRPGGFLFLGSSEGSSSSPELFEVADKKNRIFRRRETLHPPAVEFPLAPRLPTRGPTPVPPGGPTQPAPAKGSHQKVAATFERTVLDEYCWPSLLVDERGTIVLAAGRVGRFLQPSTGALTSNLLDAARGSLRIELRAALRAASETGRRILRDRVTVELEDAPCELRIVVRPMPVADPDVRLYVVVLKERPADGERVGADIALTPSFDTPALQQLESELRATHAELKATVEAADATNEELKSANEELISTNEELQAANEELQTSKEELQSLNEELETVNAELRNKVAELAAANGDLRNLFAATAIATVFLDRSLRVARFTPAATALLHLIASDVGRPLADLAPRFAGEDVVSDAREVLRVQAPIERQVRSAEGAWFVLRILPYRTIENVIAGVVVTFVDVTAVKRAEETARQQAQLVQLSHDAIFIRRFDGTIESWNRGAEELYGYRPEQAIGRITHDLLGTVLPRPLGEIERELRQSGSWAGELRQRTWDGRTITVLSNIQLARGDDGVERLLEANRDITERKAQESRLAYLASFPAQAPHPIVEADLAGRVRYANRAARELLPDIEEQGAAHPWLREWAQVVEEIERGASGVLAPRNVVAGGRFYLQALTYLAAEQVVRVYGLDVTERRRAEVGLRASEARFAAAFRSGPMAIGIVDAETRRLVEVNDAWVRLYGFSPEEALGRTSEELGIVPSEEERQRLLAAAMRPDEPLLPSMRIRNQQGELVDVVVRTAAITLNGRPCLLSSSLDYTAQKRAEQMLRESEERFRTLADNAQDAIMRLDREGRYLYVNPFYARIVGLPPESIVGRTMRELGRDTAGNTVTARVGEVFATGEVRRFDHLSREGRWYDVQFMLEGPGTGHETVLSVARDITERKQIEAALQASERRYRSLFDNMTEEVHTWELVRGEQGEIRTWRLVDANAAALRAWGTSLEELRGGTPEEIFGPGATEHYMPVVQKIFAEGAPCSFDDYLPKLDRHFRFTSVPLGDHFITTGADVTEIQKALAEAEGQRAQLEAVFHAVQDGIAVADASGRFVMVNDAQARINGFASRAEMLRDLSYFAEVFELRRPDGSLLPVDQWPLSRVLRGESIADCELRGRRKDIVREWFFSFSGEPVRDEQGRQILAALVTRDITARKLDEQRSAIVGRLYAVLSRVNESIVRTHDEHSLFEQICQTVAEAGGFPLVWIGLVRDNEIAPVARSGSAGDYLDAIRVEVDGELGRGPTGTAVRENRTVVNDDVDTNPSMTPWRTPATQYGFRASAAFPLHRQGAVIGALTLYAPTPGVFDADHIRLLEALCADVSYALDAMTHEARRAEAEHALRDSERHLREVDQRKNEFLAVLSHELRNPLAPIKNSLYVLGRSTPGSAQAMRAQAVLDRQVSQLVRLVDDLLDVTRITRNKVQLRRERLELNELVRRTVEDQRSVFDGHGVRLEAELAPANVFVEADRERLSQVVGNLLQNAAKFTMRDGSVRVTVTADASARRAILRVADTGVGMQPETLARLFQPFVQAEQTLDRSKGGLGLGLALVKGLVELHGGEVSAQSEGLGRGTVFTVRLPLQETAAAEVSSAPVSSGRRRRRVLVVEDNRDAAESLRGVLELIGHEVAVAHSGPEALQKARTLEPEVVLCDIGLPGMDGYEVARAFRADELLRKAFLVALSGYALPEDLQRSASAGFAQHLAKPPSIEKLETLLDRLGAPVEEAARQQV